MRFLKTPACLNSAFALCAILVALFCSAMGYFTVFANLRPTDDEGQLIMTVKNFLSGNPMYGAGGSIYGPYYYFYEWAAHSLMGVQISTESARFVSLAFWIAASLLTLLLTYRATGSPIIALGAQYLVFRALAFIPDSTAHPQELCIVLLVGFGLAGYAKNRALRMVLPGALAGAMMATKINAGAFLVLALALVFAYSAKAAWLRHLAFLSFGATAFPIVLMWGHHADPWAQRYGFVMVVSLAAAILVVSRMELVRDLEIPDILLAGAGFAGAIAAGSVFSLLHGGSIQGMLNWIVLTPGKSFSQAWFIEAYVRKDMVPWAIAALVLAWCAATKRLTDPMVALLKLGFACGVVFFLNIDWWRPFDPGFRSWEYSGGYSLTIFFAAPFLWLVAIPGGGPEAGNRDGFARALLALAAVIHLLYAYPVAGSPQVRIAAVLVIVAAGVCLSDGLRYLSFRWPQWSGPVLARAIAPAVGILLVGLSLNMALEARQRYQAMEPLNVAGMQRIHVPPDQGYAMRELVQRVSAHGCTKLLTVPSVFSLNLWTGTQPFTTDAGNWVNATSDAKQQRLVESLWREPQTCIIYSRQLVDEWMPKAVQDVSFKPIVRFLKQYPKTEYTVFVKPHFDYEFMVWSGPQSRR